MTKKLTLWLALGVVIVLGLAGVTAYIGATVSNTITHQQDTIKAQNFQLIERATKIANLRADLTVAKADLANETEQYQQCHDQAALWLQALQQENEDISVWAQNIFGPLNVDDVQASIAKAKTLTCIATAGSAAAS